jgi:hypothetical protein
VAERLDEVASRSIDLAYADDVTAEIVTIAELIAFATVPTLAPPPLTAGSFIVPGDGTYVVEAQKLSSNNPARSDLDGLAQNTYQLKVDVGSAFGISLGSIGGRAYRPYKSDHTTGHAIDIPGTSSRGDAIAAWVVERASTYRVKYIIFNYRIWYPGKGWKAYNPSSSVKGFASDAGHVRHVHVSTY